MRAATARVSPRSGCDRSLVPTMTSVSAGSSQWPAVSATVGATSTALQSTKPSITTPAASRQVPSGTSAPPRTGAVPGAAATRAGAAAVTAAAVITTAATAPDLLRMPVTVPCSPPMRHARIWSVPVAALAVALGCGPSTKPEKPAAKPPAKDPWQIAVAAQVKPYITNEIVTGVMIGVIDGDREWTYGFGSSGNGNAAPTAQTLFELGAATKVYTAVLLADAIERKEVALATEIATLMPLGVTVPTAGGAAITVEQLVTQRS